MIVKICGITTREDALAAADAGASALGFNFYPGSPRYITPERAAEIGAGLSVTKVGVFVNEAPSTVAETAVLAGLDIVQLHGEERPDSLPFFSRIWKAFRIRTGWRGAEMDSYAVEAFLLDGPVPGSGEAFDWTIARSLGRPIILAGGLDADNVAAAIREVRPLGVDACSRLESAPGIKDHSKMRRFIEAALSENQS